MGSCRPLAGGSPGGPGFGHHPGGTTGFSQDWDPERLRAEAWQIAAARHHEHYLPDTSYVTLAAVGPREALCTWRIRDDWMEWAGRTRAGRWDTRRLVLRLYDVTLIEFNGFNAHRIQDFTLDRLAGEALVTLPAPGRVELAEVGCLLSDGEFVPAARSQVAEFPSGTVSAHHDTRALFVDDRLEPESVPTVWEAGAWLRRRRASRLRIPLGCAILSFESSTVGDQGYSAVFPAEIARELAAQGHEVHLLLPSRSGLESVCSVEGIWHHPLGVGPHSDPLEQARAFAEAAESVLHELGRIDLLHLHEWMTGAVPSAGTVPTLLSLTSLESTRAGAWSERSAQIAVAERSVASRSWRVLVPGWLRERAQRELELGPERVLAFPLEGRHLSEWEKPLDLGQVRLGFGLGPLERVFLFVGPLEWCRGPDLLVEAWPVVLSRSQVCRLVFVGLGEMQGALEQRARELGVAHAVRLLGHLEGEPLTRLLRAAEAVIIPARDWHPADEGVVLLARRAGRPVITTERGPRHLVAHDQDGLVTFDNPGSMVWAISELVCDPFRAELLGRAGLRVEDPRPLWSEVATEYLDLCGQLFPELVAAAAE